MQEINSSWARVALLPNDVPEDLVDYLYERAVTVWICSDGTPEENYRAILKGAHGVISEDWAQTKADLATFTNILRLRERLLWWGTAECP